MLTHFDARYDLTLINYTFAQNKRIHDISVRFRKEDWI